MRPIRPLFQRSASRDELARSAERLRNRDWIEILRVIHPAQAEQAEREYLLARLQTDWSALLSPLLAQHTQPVSLRSGKLLILCDHNTFANEIAVLSPILENKIYDRYGIELKIHSKATKMLVWSQQDSEPEKNSVPRQIGQRSASTHLQPLIDALLAYEEAKK